MNTQYAPFEQIDEALMMMQEEFAADDSISDCMSDLPVDEKACFVDEDEYWNL